MRNIDLVIIGGGSAGMASAIKAKQEGINDILIIEKDEHLGGILNQCIHNGFGLTEFKEELTGPEYLSRFVKQVEELNIPYLLNTMVIDMTEDKIVTISNKDGVEQIKAKAIIMATGCYERGAGAIQIPGDRCAGIITAGTAQKYLNIYGYMVGKKIVILGSGDIGLIMARRMTLEGAKVEMVCELMPFSGGLQRNIVQCLEDMGIPLKLSCTVIQTHGIERLEGVTIANVDENRRPIPGTEQYVECDTLLLSVGLIPENELTRMAGIIIDPVTNGAVVDENRQTSRPGIFACGNVLQVHDLVDYVTAESQIAGEGAAAYIKNKPKGRNRYVSVKGKDGVRYVVPQNINENTDKDVKLYFRVADVFRNARIIVESDGKVIYNKKKPKLAPGEMEYVIIKAEDIHALEKKELVVRLEVQQ